MNALQKALLKLAINGILCDLDDTLINTAPVFGKHMDMYSEVVSRELSVDFLEFRKNLQEINDRTFAIYSVRRSKWQIIIAELVNLYGPKAEDVLTRYYYILDNIYNIAPEFKEGAIDFLLQMKEIRLPVCLITHANTRWTYLKMNTYDLWKHTHALHIVSENQYKSYEEWLEGCKKVYLFPYQVLGIGDSIVSDMIPAFNAGIPYRIWLKNKNAWSIYVNHELPRGTITLNGIYEVIPKIIELAG